MDHWFSELLQMFISHRESEFLKEWFCSTKLAFLCLAEAMGSSQVSATQVTPGTTVVL